MIDRKLFEEYQNQLFETLRKVDNKDLELKYKLLLKKFKNKKRKFICGNGVCRKRESY